MCLTQMHGLNLKSWMKWGLTLLLALGAVIVYSGRGVSHLWEIGAIPLIDYLAVLILFLLLGLIVWITGWRRPQGIRKSRLRSPLPGAQGRDYRIDKCIRINLFARFARF